MRKEKTIDKNKKMFLIAFIVPFINMIAFLIEYAIALLKHTEEYKVIYAQYSEFIGAFLEFCLVPLLFVIALIIPKKFLKYKAEILHTLCLMFMFGWILILVSLKIAGFIKGLIS